jgi:hypothetical protein
VPRIVRPVFDRDAAFRLLAKQCDFGPRVPGTDGHDKTRAFLVAELSRFTARVQRQDFRYRGITMTNIIAAFGPAGPPRVLLCAHWDTRPTADMEVDEAKRAMPIPGANDGASGVAVLLELARGFKQQAPPVGVVIALLDGEDFGDFRRDEGVLLGAKHLARNQAPLGGTPRVGILLDMVGGRDLLIRREANSDRYARAVNDLVFQTARDLGYGERFVEDPITITDDHPDRLQLRPLAHARRHARQVQR